VGLQYDLQHRLRGGAPSGLERVEHQEEIEGPARRGAVKLVGDCAGLYWSDGARWWPLELSDDAGLVLDATLGPRDTVLLRGVGWQLTAEATAADEVTFVYRGPEDTQRRGDPVGRSDLHGDTLTVWLDRVNSELTVRAGHDDVLVAWFTDLTGPVAPGPGVEASPAPAPLCERLQARTA
jgi:hypothetical protein